MRAKYVVEAIQALAQTESFLHSSMSAQQQGELSAKVYVARMNLQRYSGLGEIEISVEKEPA